MNKLFIFFICFLSCNKSSSRPESIETETIKITHKTIELKDIMLGSPELSYIMDSFLVILDSKSDSLFHIINLKNMKAQDFGRKGQGPEEFIHPFRLLHNNKNTLSTWDMMQRTLIEISPQNVYNQYGCYTKKILTTQDTERDYILLPVNNRRFISIGAYQKGMLKLRDSTGTVIDTFFEYPYRDNTEKALPVVNKALAYQGSIMTDPTLTKLCYACVYAPIINFYDVTEESILLIKSITEGYANYKKINNSSAIMPENKLAYVSIYTTKEFVFALYSGKSHLEHKQLFDLGEEIRVFDWNGSLVKKYTLDTPISQFCVTPDNKYIYATADKPDPTLIYFRIE